MLLLRSRTAGRLYPTLATLRPRLYELYSAVYIARPSSSNPHQAVLIGLRFWNIGAMRRTRQALFDDEKEEEETTLL